MNDADAGTRYRKRGNSTSVCESELKHMRVRKLENIKEEQRRIRGVQEENENADERES